MCNPGIGVSRTRVPGGKPLRWACEYVMTQVLCSLCRQSFIQEGTQHVRVARMWWRELAVIQPQAVGADANRKSRWRRHASMRRVTTGRAPLGHLYTRSSVRLKGLASIEMTGILVKMPLSSLACWIEQSLTTLFSTGTVNADFDQDFIAVVDGNAEIRLNSQPMNSSQFLATLLDMKQQWEIRSVRFLRTLDCLEDVAYGPRVRQS
jgi:hypothetical protein